MNPAKAPTEITGSSAEIFHMYTKDTAGSSILQIINNAQKEDAALLLVEKVLKMDPRAANERGKVGFKSDVHVLQAAFDKCLYKICRTLIGANAICEGFERISDIVNAQRTPPTTRRQLMPQTPEKPKPPTANPTFVRDLK